MKNVLIIISGIILITASYMCTYWFDAIKGQDAREMIVATMGVFLFIVGFVSIICGMACITIYIDEK